MPRTEDGQFEMLLGNKQLLSILFIVVILMGVFFTMGYVLGRNSATEETASVAMPAQRTAQPPAPDSGVPSPFPASNPPSGSVEPVQLPRVESPAPAPVPELIRTERPPVSPGPAPGESYLQVAAVKRPEAELISEILKKKGFAASIAPHPTEPVYRVLVGPLGDVDEVAKVRADLQTAGFKPILRKF